MRAQTAARRGSTGSSVLLSRSSARIGGTKEKPRSVSSARPTTRGGFSEGYLRGVFDKTELPQVTQVKVRADYRFEPNTLDIMQQSAGVAMSPQTHRQVEASQGDLQLSSVPRPEGEGVHFRIRTASTAHSSDTWNEAKRYVEVCWLLSLNVVAQPGGCACAGGVTQLASSAVRLCCTCARFLLSEISRRQGHCEGGQDGDGRSAQAEVEPSSGAEARTRRRETRVSERASREATHRHETIAQPCSPSRNVGAREGCERPAIAKAFTPPA